MTTEISSGKTATLRRKRHRLFPIEWPTFFLLIACYLLWLGGGFFVYAAVPIVGLLLMGVAVALHSSLQHEVLHGHPTRSAVVNEALVFLPIGLFYPYRSYKHSHLQHHADERLTDPYDDPESYYRAMGDWQRMPSLLKRLLAFNNTLIGRVLIGPALMVVGFTASEWKRIARRDDKVIFAWLLHAAGLLPVGLVIELGFGIPLWLYAVTSAYLGVALIAVRSFCEHQWAERADGRTIIVEKSILAPLFLHNNLHLVHHKLPTAAWYRLPGLYKERRAEWLALNDHYVFASYLDVIRAYAFRAKEPVVHPALRRDEVAMIAHTVEPVFDLGEPALLAETAP